MSIFWAIIVVAWVFIIASWVARSQALATVGLGLSIASFIYALVEVLP